MLEHSISRLLLMQGVNLYRLTQVGSGVTCSQSHPSQREFGGKLLARCSYRKVCPHSEVEEVMRTLDTVLSLDISPS